MDVIQFGKWISERRRKYGWPSQRAMSEAIRCDPTLSECHISEDFLARLEAGRLAYPFRGHARKQVFALASFLCKSPRELHAFLQAAGLTELSQDETEQLARLNAYLTPRRTAAVSLLPARPLRLLGREAEVCELVNALCTLDAGLYALTGMPGVGKSALAYEAMHRLASHEYAHVFPDGIITLSCTGRQGTDGLITLLNEIIALFSHHQESAKKGKQPAFPATPFTLYRPHADLASAIDHTRMILADKSVLFLLDDVDAQFPLRRALDALLGLHVQSADAKGYFRRVVLTTSRHVPILSLVKCHHHVDTLQPKDAHRLFVALMNSSSALRAAYNEQTPPLPIEQICAALGYLPLAIEVAANAVTAKGIPLSLLASSMQEQPLNNLLDGDEVLYATLEQAFEDFDEEMQEHFALLSTLGKRPFGLESAMAVYTKGMLVNRLDRRRVASADTVWSSATISSRRNGGYQEKKGVYADNGVLLDQLAHTAAELGHFVGHSLLERVSDDAVSAHAASSCYQLHPLLYAYARKRLHALEPELVHTTQHQVQSHLAASL